MLCTKALVRAISFVRCSALALTAHSTAPTDVTYVTQASPVGHSHRNFWHNPIQLHTRFITIEPIEIKTFGFSERTFNTNSIHISLQMEIY